MGSEGRRVKCGLCGGVIQSMHRHNFVTCPCGALSVDGGSDYERLVGAFPLASVETEDGTWQTLASDL